MRSTFTFNGHRCDEFGIYISKKPNINRSARKFKSTSVAGRNGNIYQMQDAWDEVIVSYDIFAGGYNVGDAPRDFTSIMEWLNSADDYAVLCDSFDEQHYRMAVFVDATNIEQKWYSTGKATIKFRCRPQNYLAGSVVAVEDGDTIKNPTNHVALPIITLTGSGAHSLYDMEKTSPDANYGNSLIMIQQFLNFFGTIRIDPNFAFNSTAVTMLSDSYASNNNKMNIISRSNSTGSVSFSALDADHYGVGTGFNVNADSDYTISASSNRPCTVRVLFCDTNGYFTSEASKSVSSGDIALTFHTPTDCTQLLIVFFTTNSTSITISSIMLAKGSEAQTFKSYAADTTETFTIGDTTLKILLNGFSTAVIDCERENFSVDGVDNNTGISLVDQYGNIAVDYLRLNKGDNAVAYSSGITAAVMDMRLWEL